MSNNVLLVMKPTLTDAELNALFAAAWPHHRETTFAPVFARSLTWVAARTDDRLVGFINVATDGGAHAFVLDTTVHPTVQRQGVGRRLVMPAIEQARAEGVTWLHVDYEARLDGFYRPCGFRPTAAGLLRLN